MIQVCPSSYPCPVIDLLEYVKLLESIGVEYLHCDVMDGNFVCNSDAMKEISKKLFNSAVNNNNDEGGNGIG